MVLATHIVTGAVLATSLPAQPVLAFAAGFISHFLLDAIPHWDYKLNSLSNSQTGYVSDTEMDTSGRKFLSDLLKILLDVIIGVAGLLLLIKTLHWQFSLALVAGALGAILPDFLQFVYFKTKSLLLRDLQRFHVWIHSQTRLDNRYILGPFLQTLLVLVLLAIIRA